MLAGLLVGPVEASSEVDRISGEGLIDPACLADGAQIESEAEPYVAVNPTDDDNVVAIWQQDRYSDSSGARGTAFASTLNGGRTWTTGIVPKHSVCTGGPDQRASDPWVSIGPDGTVYAASFTFQRDTQTIDPSQGFNPSGDPNALLVSTSKDGGLTWAGPVEIHRGVSLDMVAITPDPNLPGTAYVVWLQTNWYSCLVADLCSATNAVMFSRTDDRGSTWTAARPILVWPFPFEFPGYNRIEVLPDGTLVNVYEQSTVFDTPEESARACVLGEGGPCGNMSVRVLRSDDGGLTWSQPIVVAGGGDFIPLLDPEPDSSGVRPTIRGAAGWQPNSDVAPDGSVYVTWANRTPSDVDDPNRVTEIMVARSEDGGRTWLVRPAFRVETEAFLPTLALDDRGTMGIVWYDWRNDRLGDAELTTDVWFASSRDGGVSWKERHLAGPFDIRTAPRASLFEGPQLFIGDYIGLAGGNKGFVAAFIQVLPAATVGQSDVFAARIQV